MIYCTRRIEFDTAHRVCNHESKCKYLHGHRYALEASFASPKLDTLGRVIDFGTIRDILGGWINENWDHNTVLHEKDQAVTHSAMDLPERNFQLAIKTLRLVHSHYSTDYGNLMGPRTQHHIFWQK